MGKMVYLLTALLVINIALVLAYDVNIPFSNMWELFKDPSNWESLSFIGLLTDTIAAIASVAFIGGLIFKNDLLVFAGLAGVLLTFGSQLVALWQTIVADTGTFGDASHLIAALFVGGLTILYLFTVLEFWRGRD